MIPFVDIKARHAPIREEFLKAIGGIIDSGELDDENELRRQHVRQYDDGFALLPGVVPPCKAGDRKHVYHLHAIRTRKRRQLTEALSRAGIQCGAHYPDPLLLQSACAGMGYKRGACPVDERCAGEFVSRPMLPELTPEQIGCVLYFVENSLGESAHPS